MAISDMSSVKHDQVLAEARSIIVQRTQTVMIYHLKDSRESDKV